MKRRNRLAAAYNALRALLGGDPTDQLTVVPMEFSPEAYALLNLLAIKGNHPSVDSYIRAVLADDARAFGQALADTEGPTTAEIFNFEP